MKKMIITGSHGRVGTGITAALKKDYEVFEINRSGEEADHYFLADVGDFRLLKEVFEKIGQVDYVIHLAGEIGRAHV